MLFGRRMGVPRPSSNMEDRDSPHQQAILGCQQGVLRIQLNSDSVNLKIQLDFTRLLPHPLHKHISEASQKPRFLNNWLQIGGCIDSFQLRMLITSSGCFLLTSYKSDVPTMPFLDLINLLEKLTELRNALLTKSPVYYKRTSTWKSCTRQGE